MKPIIEVKGLSKCYKLGVFNARSLREEAEAFLARFSRKKGGRRVDKREGEHSSLSSLPSPSAQSTDFWALWDVSFDVQPGEVVGIIGRNGAGKSTLLKILSRITEPTSGEARIRGRVASLLEVGTGFHPELSGRENIFLNGAILGMTKAEIRSKFDEIVEFSGVEQFIDTPVKRYSSGMYVRLAFAVAAHLEPEILIVDEVLAVGDASFQKKCLGKMKEVSEEGGRTVLFVSHNMTAVSSLCSRSILLKDGQAALVGNTEEVIRQYLMDGGNVPQEVRWEGEKKAPGNEKLHFQSVRVISKQSAGGDQSLFDMVTPIDIEIDVCVIEQCMFHVTLHFVTDQGLTAFTSGGIPLRQDSKETLPGEYRLTCHIPAYLLNAGGYSIRLLLVEDGTRVITILEDVIGFEVKDFAPREVGEWQGREPGAVRPRLDWNTKIIC